MTTTLPYQFIDKLKALPFIEAVYLFGSRARGDNQRRSDIDLAVKMQSGTDSAQWQEVLDIVDEADTLLEIDCVDLDKADEKFRDRILQEGKLL